MTASEITPGFMVIHGNQPELLRELLVHWFKAHPLSPLEDEAILVQSNGIAQWLKLALAANATAEIGGGCGIAASLDMLLPSRFVWQAYRSVLGHAAVPEASPFDKPLLVWRLMRLLPDLVTEPGYEPLARFLKDDSDLRKRYQLSEKIADLFDQYQVYRADWLDAWAKNENVLVNARGVKRPLGSAHQWQAMLWRALLNDVGQEYRTSRASVHQRFIETAAQLQTRPKGLPRRVSVFGLSSLPRQSLEALLAISRFTQVILCVHNPCEHYWANLLSEKDHARKSCGRHSRKKNTPDIIEEKDLHLHAHPLLAAWGKQGRDYIALLDELDSPDQYRAKFEAIGEQINLFRSNLRDNQPPTLLNELQEDLLNLRSVTDIKQEPWPPVDPQTDHSIRFHIAHSTQREVEILQDQLLAAFNADPTLRPRDVIVMVPDVNQYAPHIEAVFGQINSSDPRYIPFSIADQAKRHQAPLAFALEFLLGVTESRLTVSDLLDLLDVPAVRQRFGIKEDDVPRLHQWITDTKIRWGLSAKHRAQFIEEGYEQNTWMHGLKRMLLGYAVGCDPTERDDYEWHDIEPYGEVSGLDAALAGPLARLLIKLEAIADTFVKPANAADWNIRLQTLISDFFESETPEDSYLVLQIQSSLQTWADACHAAGFTEPMPISVIREHWLDQFDRPNLAQRFMAGKLTFATLMPMRAIPFRIVCLLGMSDGEFPRSRPPVDFDLMAQEMRPGDRSRREDDHYLFLEALLSAREKLYISWIGRSIRDNTERPTSVLVSQLRDHLDACWQLAKESPWDNLLSALTVEHKLQAFSRDYFSQDQSSLNSPLFTYAKEWERSDTRVAELPEPPLTEVKLDSPVSLGKLIAFLKDPVKTFFLERLGVDYRTDDLKSEDQEPFAIDALGQWGLQNLLIKARLDALLSKRNEEEAVRQQLARIQRRGELPVGSMATLLQSTLTEPLDKMFELYGLARNAWPQAIDDAVFEYTHPVASQRIDVQGRLTHCYAGNDGRCRIELNSSNLIDGKQRYRRDKLLPAWIMHLASHLGGTPITTLIVGKNAPVVINPLDPDEAKDHFNRILEAYIAGLSSPLPVAPGTAFAWLNSGGEVFRGALSDCDLGGVGPAREQYDGNYNFEGEAKDSPYLQRVYPDFEKLWSGGRFTELCSELYEPLNNCVGQTDEAE